MTEFAVAVQEEEEYRLIKWDGATETEIASFSGDPTFSDAINALADHHSVGNSPFPSREAMIDSLELSHQWPVPTRDLRIGDETMPWE